MSDSPRTAVLAVVALVLGLLSLLPPFFVLAGVPALVLGAVALRNVHASDGRLRGRIPALVAMLLGGLTALLSIVSLLSVGLLSLRETSDRTTAQEHLRRIGIALNQYHDFPPPELQTFPPAGLPNPNLPPEKRLSWLAGLLPYLDQTPLPQPADRPRPPSSGKTVAVWETLHRDSAWDAEVNRIAVNTTLPVFLSPAHPKRSDPGEPGLTHYVGFSGVGDSAAMLRQDDPNAGFFGYERRLNRAMIQAGRGTSNLLAAAETGFHNGPWASAPASVRPLAPDNRPYSGVGRPFGGLHPGGLNVLRADGSVRFQSNDISPTTFEMLVRLGSPP